MARFEKGEIMNAFLKDKIEAFPLMRSWQGKNNLLNFKTSRCPFNTRQQVLLPAAALRLDLSHISLPPSVVQGDFIRQEVKTRVWRRTMA